MTPSVRTSSIAHRVNTGTTKTAGQKSRDSAAIQSVPSTINPLLRQCLGICISIDVQFSLLADFPGPNIDVADGSVCTSMSYVRGSLTTSFSI